MEHARAVQNVFLLQADAIPSAAFKAVLYWFFVHRAGDAQYTQKSGGTIYISCLNVYIFLDVTFMLLKIASRGSPVSCVQEQISVLRLQPQTGQSPLHVS